MTVYPIAFVEQAEALVYGQTQLIRPGMWYAKGLMPRINGLVAAFNFNNVESRVATMCLCDVLWHIRQNDLPESTAAVLLAEMTLVADSYAEVWLGVEDSTKVEFPLKLQMAKVHDALTGTPGLSLRVTEALRTLLASPSNRVNALIPLLALVICGGWLNDLDDPLTMTDLAVLRDRLD